MLTPRQQIQVAEARQKYEECLPGTNIPRWGSFDRVWVGELLEILADLQAPPTPAGAGGAGPPPAEHSREAATLR